MHNSPDTAAENRLPLSLLKRLDRVGDRFEDAWAAGQRPVIETFLAESPEPERALLLRALLGLELDLRRRGGETPQPTEYLSRFPEYAAVIHEVFAETLAVTPKPESPEAASWPMPPERGSAPGAESSLGGRPRTLPGHATGPETAAAAAQEWPAVPGYEIQGELGRGGMGVVYRARHLGLERVVALKMIRAGAQASPDELARFRSEAALQARVHHPNIVQIFEVGEAGSCPYFALECVEGASLDKRIAGTPQPARAAAQLVETLARAVQHAHAKGLVHRDLKPANILVAADGTPKVGDFGLAKRLEGDAGQTQSGAVIGTPNYLAPEQAWGRLKAIGRATDVYALGTILYELLTGRPPFLGATAADTIMQVRHQEPVPPRRLLAQVPHDLETICLKCLRKEPGQRYASALDLADDLKRFLNGEPIQARPVSAWERGVKWAQRRPAIAALFSVLLVVLVGGFFGMMELWLRAEAARQAEAVQRRRAEANEQRAELASDRTLTALENLARAYRDAGRTVEAIALYEQVRDARVQRLGAGHSDTLTTLNNLADVYREAGHVAAAIALYEQVRDTRVQKLGADHPDTLTTVSHLADAYLASGQTAKAVTLFGQVHEAAVQSLLGTGQPSALPKPAKPDALTSTAAGRTGGRGPSALPKPAKADALALLEPLRDAQVQKLGAGHPDTLTTLNNLADAYRAAGKGAEAIAVFEQVHDICVKHLGTDHPRTLTALKNLADAYLADGQTPKAIALYEQVWDKEMKQLGLGHPRTLVTLNKLSDAYLADDQTVKAIALFEQVRDAEVEKLWADHPDTLAKLALAYQAAGKLEQALRLFQQAAMDIEKRRFRHANAASIVGNLSDCYEQLKQYEPAETWRRKWLAVAKEKSGPQSADYGAALAALSRNLLLQHKHAEAEQTFRDCLALRAQLEPETWTTFDTQSMLGEALLGQQRYAEAEPLLKGGYEGLKAREKALPPQAKARLTETLERLVQLYDAWGKPEQAATWRKQLDQAKPPAREVNR